MERRISFDSRHKFAYGRCDKELGSAFDEVTRDVIDGAKNSEGSKW